jgi:hypothetical protein
MGFSSSSETASEGVFVNQKSCWGGGGVSLYVAGLADEAGFDARPDAAGGEGGHGATKPQGVVHW